MWFTKDENGFKGWFRVERNGLLFTGISPGSFTITIIDPADSTINTPVVVESTAKGGVYTFPVPTSFLTVNGVGEYGVSIEVNKPGPEPIDATFFEVLRVFDQTFDDLTVPFDPMTLFSGTELSIVDRVWDEAVADHLALGSMGRAQNDSVSGIPVINNALIADAVWDEFMVEHQGSGTAGAFQTQFGDSASVVADAVWDEPLSTHLTVGTAGQKQAFDAYRGAVWIDTANGSTGTTVGTNGTETNPVTTLADAVTIAAATGHREFRIRQTAGGPLTLSGSFDEWRFIGIGAGVVVALANQDVDGSFFDCMELSGVQNGTIAAMNCSLDGVTGMRGVYRFCRLKNSLAMADVSGGSVVFEQCISEVAGAASTPILDLGVAHTNTLSFHFRHYAGGITLTNMDNAGDAGSIDMVAGQVILGSTMSAGDLALRGVGRLDDTSIGGMSLNKEGFLQESRIVDATWDETLSDHLSSGSTGEALDNVPTASAIADAVWGEILPQSFPTDSAGDRLTNIDIIVTSLLANQADQPVNITEATLDVGGNAIGLIVIDGVVPEGEIVAFADTDPDLNIPLFTAPIRNDGSFVLTVDEVGNPIYRLTIVADRFEDFNTIRVQV